jgi:hypothetical protein
MTPNSEDQGLGAAQEGSAGHAEPAVGVENGGLGPRGAGTGGSGGGGLTPGPQVPVNSQSRENPWTTVISVIALLVSFYGLYQSQQANGLSNEANQLSAKANDLAAASNRASADALKIANDGATASVSVAEARLSGAQSFFAPIEIDLEVRNTGERDAENVMIQFPPAVAFPLTTQRIATLSWVLAPAVNTQPLRVPSLAREASVVISAKTNFALARFANTKTQVRVAGVVEYTTATNQLQFSRAFCFQSREYLPQPKLSDPLALTFLSCSN